MLNYFIPITLTLLFIALKFHVGPIQIRPFDGFVLIFLTWLFMQPSLITRTKISIGFVVLLPFYLVHVLSALSVSPENGFREILQVVVLLGFAFGINAVGDRIDYEKAGKVLMVGLFAVMLYNIEWHIAHGFWSGWKRLLDPKAAFTYLPMLISLFLLFSPAEKRRFYWILWGVVGVAVLFSGERKALLVYGIVSVALVSSGRLLLALPALAAAVFALSIFATLSNNEYLARQVRTLLEPEVEGPSLAALAEGKMPRSISDAQRRFALDQVDDSFREHPVFGIGTNAYPDLIRQRFALLPDYLLTGVHGEPLRVLVENGLVGIVCYLAIWISAVVRIFAVASYFRRQRYFSTTQARLLPILILTPSLFYSSFEASGTRVFMSVILVSMAPALLLRAVTKRRRANGRATEARDMETVICSRYETSFSK